jgi:hypothetical protein
MGPRPGQRHDVVGSITRRRCPWFEAGPAASDRLVDIVNTPTRSPAAPSEMPPAGRRWAPPPPVTVLSTIVPVMQQANGSGAGRRWKAWGCVHRQTGQNASRRLPHELGGVFWRRRNHPLTRQLSCCPVCGPVCRAKFSSLHASSCKQPQPSPALILQLVGVFLFQPGSAGIDGAGGTISSYRGCSYASQRHSRA